MGGKAIIFLHISYIIIIIFVFKLHVFGLSQYLK